MLCVSSVEFVFAFTIDEHCASELSESMAEFNLASVPTLRSSLLGISDGCQGQHQLSFVGQFDCRNEICAVIYLQSNFSLSEDAVQ